MISTILMPNTLIKKHAFIYSDKAYMTNINNCWIQVEGIQMFILLFFQLFCVFENTHNKNWNNEKQP